MDNKKTAMLGGSFDPIHLGHLFLLHCAIQNTDYKRFVIVPANMSNFKRDRQLSADSSARMKMIEIALKDYRKIYPQDRDIEIVISDFELSKGGISYTYDTVCHLIEKYKLQDKLGLLIGDDHIERLTEWYKFEQMKEKVQFVICPRDGKETTWNKIPEGIDYIKIDTKELSPASATKLRQDLEANINDLSEGVRQYVRENNLYK